MVSVPSLKTLLVALLVGSAALFVIGVAIERSQPAHSAAREAGKRATAGEAATTEGATHSEGEGTGAPPTGETPAERAGEGGAAAVTEVHSERVFGLNPDATGLVITALVASVLMAAAVWRYPALAPLLIAVALASLAFAVFDVREALHQSSESRTGLVVVASLVAALHVGAAALAAFMAVRARRVGLPEPRLA